MGNAGAARWTFDFSHVDRVIQAIGAAGIHVIVGTPTYAIPAWRRANILTCLAVRPAGQNQYGPRQNMDASAGLSGVDTVSGQIRLQAYGLLASGADMVSYWHWATTNGVETYWRAY